MNLFQMEDVSQLTSFVQKTEGAGLPSATQSNLKEKFSSSSSDSLIIIIIIIIISMYDVDHIWAQGHPIHSLCNPIESDPL